MKAPAKVLFLGKPLRSGWERRAGADRRRRSGWVHVPERRSAMDRRGPVRHGIGLLYQRVLREARPGAAPTKPRQP